MAANTTYFFTASIHRFIPLLQNDALKLIIIQSWQYLIEKKLISLYGYVIMPNHIHILWALKKEFEKESPAEQFSKFTAHAFKKYLYTYHPEQLEKFKTVKADREYQFWKRDPLAIPISTDDIFIQKIDYIHHNPIKEKWSLSKYPEDYRWSSANFYETGIDEFNIITHYRDSF